jgi:hypothetical protein
MPSRIHLVPRPHHTRVPCAVSEYRPLDAGLREALNSAADVPTDTWSVHFFLREIGDGVEKWGREEERGGKRARA